MSTNPNSSYSIDQAKENLSPDLLFIILGPTASGKTKLAIDLAKQIDGEIISADSRQVYRRMDIGTGKDLREYGDIPYHLIDIKEPGYRYNVDQFRTDFFDAYDAILNRKKRPILCGGTGSYIQSILQQNPYAQIPKDEKLQSELARWGKEELIAKLNETGIPPDFNLDQNSHKRLVRGLEIAYYVQQNQPILPPQRTVANRIIFGLHPPLAQRRANISQRLSERLQAGLIDEVQSLLQEGLGHDDLIFYGLEYKYISLYLQGLMSYSDFTTKLETEIHRYAKRQMTYFRKMEKDGIAINWI